MSTVYYNGRGANLDFECGIHKLKLSQLNHRDQQAITALKGGNPPAYRNLPKVINQANAEVKVALEKAAAI